MTLTAPPSAPASHEPRSSGGAGRARRADSARQPHDGWTFVVIPPGTGARPRTLRVSVRRLRALLWGGATMTGASVGVMALLGLVLSAAPRLESEARGVALGVLATAPATPVAAPAESLATPASDSSAIAAAGAEPTPAPLPASPREPAPARRAMPTAEAREETRRRPTPPFVGRREPRVAERREEPEATTPAGASSLVSRLPVIGRITSNFSRARRHPLLGVVRRHQGVDIAAPSGTRITASAAGRVAFAGRKVGYGLVVEVDHGAGVRTRYAHCRSLLVRAGDPVSVGTTIATVGRTGLASGPHLHYEVLVRGKSVDPLRTSLAMLLRDVPVDAPAEVPAAAVPAMPTLPVPAPALGGEGTGAGTGLGSTGRDSARAGAPDVGRATTGG